MTQEDKELLLKDLCGRLQYGVKLDFYSKATNEHYVSILLMINSVVIYPITIIHLMGLSFKIGDNIYKKKRK